MAPFNTLAQVIVSNDADRTGELLNVADRLAPEDLGLLLIIAAEQEVSPETTSYATRVDIETGQAPRRVVQSDTDFAAAELANFTIIDLLLAYGAAVDQRRILGPNDPMDGKAAVLSIAERGKTAALQRMVAHGVDVTTCTQNGYNLKGAINSYRSITVFHARATSHDHTEGRRIKQTADAMEATVLSAVQNTHGNDQSMWSFMTGNRLANLGNSGYHAWAGSETVQTYHRNWRTVPNPNPPSHKQLHDQLIAERHMWPAKGIPPYGNPNL